MLIKRTLQSILRTKMVGLVGAFHKQIYVDFQATTPLDFRALDAMMPYLQDEFGNPHSRNHQYGWTADKAVEKSRSQIASLINCDAKDIIFTSGATESNNLALQGMARFYKSRKNHIITLQTEHKCILETCESLEKQGFDVTYLKVKKSGLVDLDLLKRTIGPKTLCVSTLFLNNEIGVIQPIKEIGQICKDKGIFYHVDGAQAIGKVPIDVKKMNIDVMGVTGHKCYGPKGIGALYVRRAQPRIRVKPLFHGGGQERGLRSGTLAPALCVGFGEACRIASHEMESDYRHLKKLQQKMIDFLVNKVTDVSFNGSLEHRYPGNLNVTFKNVNQSQLLARLSPLAVSSGSACVIGAENSISYVLEALGLKPDPLEAHIRFGTGRFTTEEEVDFVLDLVKKSVDSVRK